MTSMKKITYAQQKLQELIKKRGLRKWCQSTGLNHSHLFNVANGTQAVTFKLIAAAAPFIGPIDWLYYIDEKKPYEATCIPAFACTKPSFFIEKNKGNYKSFAKLFNISEITSYNIFIRLKQLPPPQLIRKMSEYTQTNPNLFFTPYDIDESHSIHEGDIVSFCSKKFLVLKVIEDSAICCAVSDQQSNISIQIFDETYFLWPQTLSTLETKTLGFIQKIDDLIYKEVVNTIVSYFK